MNFDSRLILIDAGEVGNPDYIEILKETLANQNAEIKEILVTHWHKDHLGGVNDVISKAMKSDAAKEIKVKKIRRREGKDDPSLVYDFLSEGDVVKAAGTTLRYWVIPHLIDKGHST